MGGGVRGSLAINESQISLLVPLYQLLGRISHVLG